MSHYDCTTLISDNFSVRNNDNDKCKKNSRNTNQIQVSKLIKWYAVFKHNIGSGTKKGFLS